MDVPETDVLVVGGGPAGLSAAIAARRKGFSVTLIDAAVPPIDKACGEGLMPDALRALADLGVEIPADAGFAFYGIRFLGEDVSVEAEFPSGFGLALRREKSDLENRSDFGRFVIKLIPKNIDFPL